MIEVPSFRSILPIFRGPFLELIAQGKHRGVFLELKGIFPTNFTPQKSDSLAEWYGYFYSLLVDNYRCEYVYKNNIAHQLYLKEHDPQHALLTDEFRIGLSRADVVIINDTSTVYEIKTELDSLARLESQLYDYSCVFDRIYLVTTEKIYKKAIHKFHDSIGYYLLEDDGLHKVREASSNIYNISPEFVFYCMRKPEYLSAIKEVFGYIPEGNNIQTYRRCRNLFKTLPPTLAHQAMVDVVAKRSTKKPFTKHITDVPGPLKYACLAINRPRWKPKSFVHSVMESLEDPFSVS